MNSLTRDGWYDPEATTFGDRIAGAREQAGMTQSELAKRLGIKVKTLKAWEDDLSEPRANKLSTMSGMLNVSLTWLLSGEGDGLAGPEMSDDATTVSPSVMAMLNDIRDVRSQLMRASDRLGLLEKNLRKTLKEEAAE